MTQSDGVTLNMSVDDAAAIRDRLACLADLIPELDEGYLQRLTYPHALDITRSPDKLAAATRRLAKIIDGQLPASAPAPPPTLATE